MFCLERFELCARTETRLHSRREGFAGKPGRSFGRHAKKSQRDGVVLAGHFYPRNHPALTLFKVWSKVYCDQFRRYIRFPYDARHRPG